MCSISVKAQKSTKDILEIDSNMVWTHYDLSAWRYAKPKPISIIDTIPAYIRIATGIKNGILMREWIMGYYVRMARNDSYYIGDDNFSPYYLDIEKKKINSPVVQSYY